MAFVFKNPHPEGLRVGDCIKRAIVIATGINYHDVQVMLNRYKKTTKHPNDYWREFIEKVLGGWKISEDMRFINCGQRYTVDEFAEDFYEHTCILRCSKHLVATAGGDYYDTWDSGYKGVYIAWRIGSYLIVRERIEKLFPKLCQGLSLARA